MKILRKAMLAALLLALGACQTSPPPQNFNSSNGPGAYDYGGKGAK